MFALLNASAKFEKFSQSDGGVMTFVELYSVSVLNEVTTQEYSGMTIQNEMNTSEKYLKMVHTI